MNEILNYELLHTQSFVVTVWNIVAVLLIWTGIRLLLKVLSSVLHKTLSTRSVSDGRHASFLQLISYIIWIFGIVFMLQSLNMDITFLLASSAALLVGIGLGLQNVFKDFISGIIILLDGTVKANDVVEVDGMVVRVLEVSLRSSKVVTRDDKMVIIPNHKFIEENVVNWTHDEASTRFTLQVGVDYSSDIRLVEKVLLKCTVSNSEILSEAPKKPIARLANFGGSSLDFELIFWSNNLFRIEQTKSELRFEIVEAFQKHGITIPFTQLVVHPAKIVSEL